VNILKSPRFWLAIAAIGSLTVLAALSKLGGDTAAAGILGLAGGSMLAKVGGKG
jgi:hypothetical protein